MPATSSRLGTSSVLGIPVLTLIAVVVLVVVGYYLYTARGGRELYAIGSDPDAAELYGLPVTPPGARRVRPQRRARRAGRRRCTPPATAP